MKRCRVKKSALRRHRTVSIAPHLFENIYTLLFKIQFNIGAFTFLIKIHANHCKRKSSTISTKSKTKLSSLFLAWKKKRIILHKKNVKCWKNKMTMLANEIYGFCNHKTNRVLSNYAIITFVYCYLAK